MWACISNREAVKWDKEINTWYEEEVLQRYRDVEEKQKEIFKIKSSVSQIKMQGDSSCGLCCYLWCWVAVTTQVLAAPFLIQLTDDESEKAVTDVRRLGHLHPSTRDTGKKVLISGFLLAWLQPLQPFRRWTDIWKISLSVSVDVSFK